MKNLRPSAKRQARRWRKGWWAALFILLLTGAAAGWYFLNQASSARANQSAEDASEMQTAVIRRGDLSVTASGSGSLEASRSVDLSFSTSGTVVALNVQLGDMVSAGDVLARLGSAETLEAELASAKLALIEARQKLESIQENAGVTLAQAYQDLLTAQQEYEDALTAEQRTASARCSQEVNTRYAAALERARQKLDNLNPEEQASQVWIDAKNDYDTALANYTYCTAYTALEKTNASASHAVAKAAAQQAEIKYNTLKSASGVDPSELALAEASVEQAETRLAEAQKNLEGITLVAPIDGKVISITAGVGEMVDTGTFMTIVDTSQPTVAVSVDENDMDQLTLGNAAEVVFDALPDQVFTGKVVQVDPQLTSSEQYRVASGLVALDEEAVKTIQDLPLGLNATVTIISSEAKNVLLAPVSALKELGDQEYALMVVGSDGQMKLQTVQVGIQDVTYVEIISGVEEGAVVTIAVAQAGSSSSNNPNSAGGVGPMEGLPPDEMIRPAP